MISIIIATFNAEKTIGLCLESIINQDVKTELIVIDGASTDNTINKVREYNNFDILISEPDKGIYDAWNKGIKVSKGKWIMFLGADDKLLPNTLQIYTNFLSQKNNSNLDFISSKVNYVFNAKTMESKIIGKKWNWNKFRRQMNVAHVGAIHNRNLYREVGSYDTNYKIVGDYELLLRKRNKLKVGFIDAITSEMMFGGASFSTKAIKESMNAKINTGKLFKLLAYSDYLYEFVIFKSYFLRRKLEKSLRINNHKNRKKR